MLTLIFFAFIVFIAAIASVYQDKLLFKGFVTVHSSVLSKLIPGRLPITGGKNPPDNRRRFTVVGIVLYSVSVLCIAFCVYTALTLEPVEGLEYGGGYGKWGVGEKYNSTEGLVRWVSSCWGLFEAAIYLINSIGVMLGKPDISRNKVITGIFFLVVIIFCLFMGWGCWKAAGYIWRDIQAARG